MTSDDTATPPVGTPIFDELITKAGIDWPDDVRPVSAPEPDTAAPRA